MDQQQHCDCFVRFVFTLVYTYRYTRRRDYLLVSLIGAMPAPFVYCVPQWQLTLPICQSLFSFFIVALSFSLGSDKIWRKLSFTCLLCQPLPDRLFAQVSLTHLSCPLTAFLSIFAHFHFFLFLELFVQSCKCSFGAQYSPRRLTSICCSWQPQDSTVLCPLLNNLLSISIVMQQPHEPYRCWSRLRDPC